MVPSKMKRHLAANHLNLLSANVYYLQRLLQSNTRQSELFKKTVTVSKKAQLASYEVAEIIEHTIKFSIVGVGHRTTSYYKPKMRQNLYGR